MDRGTVLELRFDGKRSVQNFQSLLHADKAKPSATLCLSDVKARAEVSNRKMNFIWRSPQSDFKVPCTTVFCRVVQGFLQYPEEAKGNVPRQRDR